MKVVGLKDLQREIDLATKEVMTAERPAEMAAGEPIRETWHGMVPVLDGNYQQSLTTVWDPKVGAVVGTAWVPGLPRDDQPFLYSKRLEFGDATLPAHPSARPALAASRQRALDAAEEPLASVVKGRRSRKRKPTQ